MYQKILVPVDGSDPSNCGLMEAINLAKDQSAKIRLIAVVVEHGTDVAYPLGGISGDFTEDSRAAAAKTLHAGASLVRQFGLDPEASMVDCLDATVASRIAEEAKAWGADLIVMGTHGRRGLKRLAMGSDADAVVRQTRIPILLIHDGSANTPEAQQAEAPAPLTSRQIYA